MIQALNSKISVQNKTIKLWTDLGISFGLSIFFPSQGIDMGKKSTRFWEQCIASWKYTWAPKSTGNRNWICAQFTKIILSYNCNLPILAGHNKRALSRASFLATVLLHQTLCNCLLHEITQRNSFSRLSAPIKTCLVLHSFQLQF